MSSEKVQFSQPYSLGKVRYIDVEADLEGYDFPSTVLRLRYEGNRIWELYRPARMGNYTTDGKMWSKAQPREHIAFGSLRELKALAKAYVEHKLTEEQHD